jgi:hypothetical protein
MPESTIGGTFGVPRNRSASLIRAGLRTPYGSKRQLTQSLRANRGPAQKQKSPGRQTFADHAAGRARFQPDLPLIRSKLIDSSGSIRVVCNMQFAQCRKSTRGQPLWRPKHFY